MTAKVTLKTLGLSWLCPHAEPRTAPCLSFHGWEGSSLAFMAIIPSQQRKLKLARAPPGDKGPEVSVPASQPTGSDLEAGLWWVQGHRVLSRARPGSWWVPSQHGPCCGYWQPHGWAGWEQVRGRSCRLGVTKDSEGHRPQMGGTA